jgi:hypothetical protein
MPPHEIAETKPPNSSASAEITKRSQMIEQNRGVFYPAMRKGHAYEQGNGKNKPINGNLYRTHVRIPPR